jgi:arginase
VHVQIIIVPYDTARRAWRSGAGPEHLLRAGLAAHLEGRGHTIAEVQAIEPEPGQPPAEIATGFELIRGVGLAVRAARESARFPLVLSGNCNASVGVLSGLTPSRRAIFWFDAHGDLNTPDTTTSGFLDGMGLATALGLCWRRMASGIAGFQPIEPEATFLLGARDLDPPESALLASAPITAVSSARVAAELPGILDRARLDGAIGHVHLDLDAFDPARVGRANTLPVPDGFSVEQFTEAMTIIRARIPLGAAALASYAPEFDPEGSVCRAAFAAIDAMLSELS